MAGDTLEILVIASTMSEDAATLLGCSLEQEALRLYVREFTRENPDPHTWPSWMRCCPRDSVVGWTVRDMGPFLIPGKGQSVGVGL